LGHYRRDCEQLNRQSNSRDGEKSAHPKPTEEEKGIEHVNDLNGEREQETVECNESEKDDGELVSEKEGDSENSEGEEGKLVIDLGQGSADNGLEGLSGTCKDGVGKENGVVKKNIQEFEGRSTPNPGKNRRGPRCSGTAGDLVPAPRFKRGRGADKSDSETSPGEKQVSSRPCLERGGSLGSTEHRVEPQN
jgi:hypothetical protein